MKLLKTTILCIIFNASDAEEKLPTTLLASKKNPFRELAHSKP